VRIVVTMLSGCWMGASGAACADDARAKVKATAIILNLFSSCLLFHGEGIAEFDDFAGRSNAHSVWVTFLERDEGKQFSGVGFALISGTDEMSIKHKRDKVGDYSGRYDNRRHKPREHRFLPSIKSPARGPGSL
jgi:hypothetical protein